MSNSKKFLTLATLILTTFQSSCSSQSYYNTTVIEHTNGNVDESSDLAGAVKIVGGTEATKYEFPGIVNLRISLTDGSGSLCGGNIVNASWILTAAHCVNPRGDVRGVTVTAGDHYINRVEPLTEQIRNVSKIVIHPSYNTITKAYDIALLQLDTPFTINQYVQQTVLANPSYISSGPAVVAGWGKSNENSTLGTNELRKTDVSFVDNRICIQNYGNVRDVVIVDSMVCASGPKRGVCNGDSGGPIVAKSTATNGTFLVGITSFGVICGDAAYPNVFQRVSSHVPWIQSYVNGVKIDTSTTSGAEAVTARNLLIHLIFSGILVLCQILIVKS